jgi:hypothetical protein
MIILTILPLIQLYDFVRVKLVGEKKKSTTERNRTVDADNNAQTTHTCCSNYYNSILFQSVSIYLFLNYQCLYTVCE